MVRSELKPSFLTSSAVKEGVFSGVKNFGPKHVTWFDPYSFNPRSLIKRMQACFGISDTIKVTNVLYLLHDELWRSCHFLIRSGCERTLQEFCSHF